ncbi:MAG: FHA domain-containing protein [Rhodopirellula sp.]|nr:FHA domain-containing protein [Rhodopirellula sp.]
MALLTFQVLDGMERGRVLGNLLPPITIGREEDNAVQLNDERVSRFHAKVQEDGGHVILTDLESTNGTRVNGHPIQMHVLRIGDQVAIGRCLLLFGSADEIEQHIQERKSLIQESPGGTISFESDEFEFSAGNARGDGEDLPRLFPDGPPELPGELRPLQVAQTSDLLAHLHDRLRSIITAGQSMPVDGDEKQTYKLDWAAWQRLMQLEMDLSIYLKKLIDPSSGDN